MGQITDAMAFSATIMAVAVLMVILAVGMGWASRTHTARNTVRLKLLTRQLTGECEGLAEELGKLQTANRQLDAEDKALATEATQLRKACAVAAQDTFQVVHELGAPTGGNRRLDVEIVISAAALNEGPAAAQVDPRVWAWKNVAQIWAPGPTEALHMAARAFPSRYGYVVTKVLTPGYQNLAGAMAALDGSGEGGGA